MQVVGWVAMFSVGLVLGLIGGGGAILTMPILVYLFGITPVNATTYSLFIVGVVSLIGVWRYHAQKLVNYSNALIFVFPSFLGTLLQRQVVLKALPPTISVGGFFDISKDGLVMSVFATVMIGASFSMIRSSPTSNASPQRSVFMLMFLGFLVGNLAGFVGAGGGFLIIPALVVLGSMSMKSAVPTSLFIITLNSMVAFGADLLGHQFVPNWPLLLTSTACAIMGLFLGIKLSEKISAKALKTSFGWFVLVMGSWILFKQF